jgi:hypothetical protein
LSWKLCFLFDARSEGFQNDCVSKLELSHEADSPDYMNIEWQEARA